MSEQICVKCRHSRKGHSRRKCEEMLRNGQDCKCTVKYMDQVMFITGEPKKEF